MNEWCISPIFTSQVTILNSIKKYLLKEYIGIKYLPRISSIAQCLRRVEYHYLVMHCLFRIRFESWLGQLAPVSGNGCMSALFSCVTSPAQTSVSGWRLWIYVVWFFWCETSIGARKTDFWRGDSCRGDGSPRYMICSSVYGVATRRHAQSTAILFPLDPALSHLSRHTELGYL